MLLRRFPGSSHAKTGRSQGPAEGRPGLSRDLANHRAREYIVPFGHLTSLAVLFRNEKHPPPEVRLTAHPPLSTPSPTRLPQLLFTQDKSTPQMRVHNSLGRNCRSVWRDRRAPNRIPASMLTVLFRSAIQCCMHDCATCLMHSKTFWYCEVTCGQVY